MRFGYLFLAIGLPGLFVTIVKRLIGRARPYVGNHDDPFAYMPFIWQPEYASMPSGARHHSGMPQRLRLGRSGRVRAA